MINRLIGNNRELSFILTAFIVWRLILFVFAFAGSYLFPLQTNFLGGGLQNYLKAPWFWAWMNFDGEHYLSVAQLGYQPLTYFFFPIYPLVIKIIGGLIGNNLFNLAIIGLSVSNISLLFALIGFWKLTRMDYSDKVAKVATILLLLFPTSFYFVSVYTESLFLALMVWSFYFARKKNWFLSGILGSAASATRVIGIILLPCLLLEYWNVRRPLKDSPLKVIWILLIPLGLLIYMGYLKQTTGDWLAFLNSLPLFGEQRSATPVILPQVFFRYIIKILPNINYSYFPIAFSTLLEVMVGMLFLILSVASYFKLRISYAIYLSLGYLIPTLSGSFSSLPRYVSVLFPAFILIATWLSTKPRLVQVVAFGLSLILLGISLSLFSRGYWIA